LISGPEGVIPSGLSFVLAFRSGFHLNLFSMSKFDSLPFSLLRQRDFAWYFWGTLVSMMGMGIHLIGVNWYILELTGSETKVSLIMMSSLSAGLLVLPFSGSIIDRHSRKAMVIMPDLIRGAIVGIVVLSIAAGWFRLWMLWPMAFALGCNHAFYFPASMSLLQEILPPEDYLKANSLREVTFQFGTLSAAGVAGWVVATFGLGGVLAFDAATYLFSAFCISRIRYTAADHITEKEHESFIHTLRSGLRYLMANKPIFVFGIMALMPFVTVMALNVLMPTFTKNTLGQGPVVYGLMDMVYGIGALSAATFIGLLTAKTGERLALVWLLAAAGSFYVGCALTDQLVPAFIFIMLVGFSLSGFRVVSQTYLMKIIPRDLMGRCTSTFFMISIGAQLTAIFSVGFLAEHVSIPAGFGFLALLIYGALAHFLFLRRQLPVPSASG
jgi:MFS family permease